MPGEAPEDALRGRAGSRAKGSAPSSPSSARTSIRSPMRRRCAITTCGCSTRSRRGDCPALISVKPTQLGLDLSIDACAAHLETLAAKAESVGSILWIDMEDSSYVDRTLDALSRRQGAASEGRARDPGVPAPHAGRHRVAAAAQADHPAGEGRVRRAGARGLSRRRPTPISPSTSSPIRMLQAAAASEALPIFGTHDMRTGRPHHRARDGARRGRRGVRDPHALRHPRRPTSGGCARDGRKVKTLISYGSAW